MLGKTAKVIGSIIIALIAVAIPVIFGMVLVLPKEYNFLKVIMGMIIAAYVGVGAVEIYFHDS